LPRPSAARYPSRVTAMAQPWEPTPNPRASGGPAPVLNLCAAYKARGRGETSGRQLKIEITTNLLERSPRQIGGPSRRLSLHQCESGPGAVYQTRPSTANTTKAASAPTTSQSSKAARSPLCEAQRSMFLSGLSMFPAPLGGASLYLGPTKIQAHNDDISRRNETGDLTRWKGPLDGVRGLRKASPAGRSFIWTRR